MASDTSAKVPRWRWAVLGLLIVGALSVPTGIIYLQHRLQVQPHDTPRAWDDPKVAQKLADARLAKAEAIRGEWRIWAMKHKGELRAMLASNGKDFSTLQAVYKVSPPLRRKDWLPDTRSGPTKFGWFIDSEKQIANGEKIRWANAESEANYKLEVRGKYIEKALQKSFADKSDFMIASSLNAGHTETQIWASGRITEKTWIQNPDRSKGKPSTIELPYKELVPPYDFLTSASSG